MRRRRAIRTLLVFVMLGAVATVLSSWAIHAMVSWRGPAMRDGGPWAVHDARPPMAFLEWPGDRVHTERSRAGPILGIDSAFIGEWRSIGWTLRSRWVCVGRGQPGVLVYSNDHLSVTRVGLPLAAMRLASFETIPSMAPTLRTTSPALSLRHGLQLVDGAPGNRYILDRFALPLLPLWPGFLINTLFYALLLFIAWRTPIFVRRAMRRRRGRCVGCGYDRNGLDPGAACPECGAGAALRPA